jgi:hypothetical protein
MSRQVPLVCSRVLGLHLLKPSGHYMYRTMVTICTAQWYYMYRTVVTLCTAQWSLYVPHHYMYRTVVTICTTKFNIHNSTFCPRSVFMCFVWISEQTAIISLYSINWLVCITETECSIFLKSNKTQKLKYNKTDHKTHFISGANFCMFRHQGAFIREFINNQYL